MIMTLNRINEISIKFDGWKSLFLLVILGGEKSFFRDEDIVF